MSYYRPRGKLWWGTEEELKIFFDPSFDERFPLMTPTHTKPANHAHHLNLEQTCFLFHWEPHQHFKNLQSLVHYWPMTNTLKRLLPK